MQRNENTPKARKRGTRRWELQPGNLDEVFGGGQLLFRRALPFVFLLETESGRKINK